MGATVQIPHRQLRGNVTAETAAHPVIGLRREREVLTVALRTNRHVVLEGPPGTGKSTLLRAIAADVGLSMAQLAAAWVLQNRNVAAAIVGASRPEQVRANVKAAGVTLDAEVMRRIDDAVASVALRDPALTPERGLETNWRGVPV